LLEPIQAACLILLQIGGQGGFADPAEPTNFTVFETLTFQVDDFYFLLDFGVRIVIPLVFQGFDLGWAKFYRNHFLLSDIGFHRLRILLIVPKKSSFKPFRVYLVPGGALSADGQSWLRARNAFFVHVKPLSRLFQSKFRAALAQADLLEQVSAQVWRQEWVVHCQPVGNGEAALKYLAPYIFRVALSNRRILKLENGQVTFRYRESDSGHWKSRTLSAEEFIRRFLQHVLPKGFQKVRYYGLFSSGQRVRLTLARQLLGQTPPPPPVETETPAPARRPLLCPTCGQAMRLERPLPRNRSP
jgi:Putative transposase